VTATVGFTPSDPAFVADPYPAGMYEVNPTEEAGRVASRAATEFSDYLRGLSRERRARPADHLGEGGDQVSEDERIGTVVLLFGTLLRRLPGMAPAAEPAWKPTYILRGLEALHVAA
jgi:cytochrome P450